MSIQKTDWGQIEWLHNENERSQAKTMSAGIVTINARSHQVKHMHYEEQMLLMQEGSAINIVDGKKTTLHVGDICHMPPGVIHEVINEENSQAKHFIVSNPHFEELENITPILHRTPFYEETLNQLYIAVEAVRTQFLETMQYAYMIFDQRHNLIAHSQNFPVFCLKYCYNGLFSGTCECALKANKLDLHAEQTIKCSHGLKTFTTPIQYQNFFLGYIQGGFVRQSNDDDSDNHNTYDTPQSTVVGIKVLLRKIAKAIRNFCEFDHFRKTLIEKDLRLSAQEKEQDLLLHNLTEAEYANTELKINHHFLFNTLNSMASMALDKEAVELYQSIIDLSKLFHYTLRSSDIMTTLDKEYKYVKAYLDLQALRYGDELEVEYDIQQEALDKMIPFNILQPIVENAFIHGFVLPAKMLLKISAKLRGDRIYIKIRNNGNCLDESACQRINVSLESRTAHGLSMIYFKLFMLYSSDFSMFLRPDDDHQGMCIHLNFPVRKEVVNK